ncbi:hypothetical protein TNCV_2669731 [Trichonephila clavipes]|nr:hypothetical protein TNCV_2669731 [Trichonephila clavipes]
MLNSCVLHRHTGPASGITLWIGIGYHSRTSLVRISDYNFSCHTRSTLERVEAAWSAVSQEHMQSLFESMLRRVAAVISNNDGYSGY